MTGTECLDGFRLINLPEGCEGGWACCISTRPLRLPVEEAGESWRSELRGEAGA